jgi:tRNA A-37 threonylcarbamoyl transferase component Bud32
VDPERVVGRELAGYSIESVLGRGAMGVLYVARQRSPERLVALKLITPALADDDVFRRRFLQEATAAAAIEHPHILPVYAAGEAGGVLFLAMRLIEGRDLRAILRTSELLPLDRVQRIVEQVGEALDAAHARGLVHRDVKPGNVLVIERPEWSGGDFCYLTDFGVSTWTASSAATTLSKGQAVGTANYMAPEQIEGEGVDGRTDLYSLGCVLFECLTGRAPFGGRSPAEIMHAHLRERAPAPSSIRSDLPVSLDEVTGRALRKAPGERYASCHELTTDLRAALAGPVVVPGSGARDRSATGGDVARPRGKAVSIVALVGVTALVIAAVAMAFVLLGDRAPADRSPEPPTPRLIRSGVQVIASSTAESSTDAAGNPVTYLPANVIDGKVDTAWRTPGNGRGESITLIFDNPVNVVRIGLIPGYAKTDPETGANRFFQDRIITQVACQVPGLPDTMKRFRAAPVPQFVAIDALTPQITVKILGTTAPHGLDYTAISEIYVYGSAS